MNSIKIAIVLLVLLGLDACKPKPQQQTAIKEQAKSY